MASGWNLWVWLECTGVVSGWCCKEVYRYPHNNYYFSLLHLSCINTFIGSSIPTSLFSFKMFFVLVYTVLCTKRSQNEFLQSLLIFSVLLYTYYSNMRHTKMILNLIN